MQVMIIGKISGAASLGIFSISYEIAHLPSTELIVQVNRVLLPGFSKMNSSVTRLRDGYMKVVPLLNMIVLPIGLGLAAVAEYLVPIILGDKWLDSIPLIVVLSIEGALVASQRTVGVVLLAAGKAKTITFMAGANIIVLIPTLIYATSEWGPIGACLTLLVATCLMITVNYGALYRYIGVTFSDFLKIYLRPTLASCVMYKGIRFYAEQQPPSEISFILFGHLIATVLLGIMIYTSTIIILWLISGRPEGPERIILRQLKQTLKRQSPLVDR